MSSNVFVVGRGEYKELPMLEEWFLNATTAIPQEKLRKRINMD